MVRPSKSGQKLSVPTSSTPERQRANLDLFMECVDEDLAPSQQVANQIATTEYKTVQKHIETGNWVPAATQRPAPKNVTVAYRPQPSAGKTVPAPRVATGQLKTTSATARTVVPSSKAASHQKTAPPLKTAPAATKVPVQKHNASKTAAAGSRSTAPLILTLPKSVPPSSQAKNVRHVKALKRPASPPDVIVLDDDEPDVVITKATVGRSSTSGGQRTAKQVPRPSAVQAPVMTAGVIPAQKMYFNMPPGAVGPPYIVPQNFSQFHFLGPMAAGIGANPYGLQLSQGPIGMPPRPTQHLEHSNVPNAWQSTGQYPHQQIHTSQKGYSGNYSSLQETENRHSSSPELDDHGSDSDYRPHGSTVGSAAKRRGRKRHSRGRGRPASSVTSMEMYHSYNNQTVHGSRQKTTSSASAKSAQTAGAKRAVVVKTSIPKKIAKLSSVDNVLEAVARGADQVGSKTSSSGRPIIKKKLADYAVKSPVKKKRGRPSNASRLSAVNDSVSAVDEAVDDDRSSWVPLAEYYYGRKEGDPSYREEKGEFKFKCWYCHVMLNNNIRMMSHIQGHIDPEKQHNFDNNNITQCKHCRQRFATPFEIQCHIEKVHKNKAKALMCLICEKDTDTQVSLQRHMIQLHKACEMPYICQLCGFRSSVYEDVIDHFKKRHDSSPHLLCLYCLKLFNLRGQFEKQANWGVTHVYYYHLQKHVINKANQRKCPNCKLIFLSKQEVSQHIIKDHAPNFRGILGNERLLLNGRASSKLQADDTVMIPLPHPNVKLLNAPTAHSHIDLSDVEFFNVEDKHNCLECGQSMTKPGHYKDYVACTMCRFATVCSDAYLNHMGLVHCAKVPHVVVDGILTNVTKRRNTRLADETYCLCGFSSTYGSVIAKHLVSCSKRTCYETPQEQRYFEYDDEDEEYNPFEPYIDDVNDFEDSDSQSPDRDIPSLFGALGLVKQPHRKSRVSRIPLPVTELKPEEMAVSVIDELLDGIFPAEAAASEFLTALMNSVDAVIVAKETKVKAVNDALVALLNHVDRVVTAKEKMKEKAIRDVINTLLDNVDKTIRHKEKTITEALAAILDNVDRIVGMKEKAIQDALDLLLCNVDSIIKAKEKKEKDINYVLTCLLDNVDKTIKANEVKAVRQLSKKTRVSLGSHQNNDELFEELKGSREWSTVELSNATMSSESSDCIERAESMDFCSIMDKIEDEECNCESSDGTMLTKDSNEKQVVGHVEDLSRNTANATDEVDVKIESEMDVSNSFPQKVDVFVIAKPTSPECPDVGCTNNAGVVEKHEVSQSVSSIDTISCRTDSYGALDVFSQHGHHDLSSGRDGSISENIRSDTCAANSNVLEKQTSVSCDLVGDQVELMDEFDRYEITGEKVDSEFVRTEFAKTEALTDVGSQMQAMGPAEESFINIDGVVSSDASETSDPEVRLLDKVDMDAEYGIHSLPMTASDCPTFNRESPSHDTVSAVVQSEANKSTERGTLCSEMVTDQLAPAVDSVDALNAEVPAISELHSSESVELSFSNTGIVKSNSCLSMQSCSGTETASFSCDKQSNNDMVETLCQYGKFDVCNDGDENSDRTVELVERGVDGTLAFEKPQFSVPHSAVPISQCGLQNSESMSCEFSVNEPSSEAALHSEASGDKNADKKASSNQLHTVAGQVAPSSSQQFRQQASNHPNKRPFDPRSAVSSTSDDYRHGNHRRDDNRHVEHRDGWRGGYDRRGGGFGDQRDYRRDYNWQGHGNWQNANYGRHGGGGQEQWGYSHDSQRRDNYHDHRQGYQYGDRRRGGYHGGGGGYNDRR